MKPISGRVTPATVDRRDTLGMDDQRPKCSCLDWDPGPPLNKAHPGARACGPNKKKSRKHLRFMARRELEQRGLLRRGEKALKVMMTDPSETCTVQDSEPWKASQCSRLTEEEAIVKTHRHLSVFGPRSTAGTVRQSSSSSQDGHTKVPLPSGSSACAGLLSCLSPKKPRKCVAIDCEMVGTGPVGRTSELARCTVVNYDGEVIYDKYILPLLPVSDYRTRWSGVTWRHMERATPFRVARGEVSQRRKCLRVQS